MSTKIFFLLAALGVVKAGFIGTTVPTYGHRTTTVYHGSALSYHPRDDYIATGYNEQFASSNSPNANENYQVTMDTSSNSEERRREENMDSAQSYGQKDNEKPQGMPTIEKTNESANDSESRTSLTNSPNTENVPGAEKLFFVPAPTFYHAAPIAYHAPLAYDSQVTYHGPIAHRTFSSAPNGKFAYSTSQISYASNPTSLLEDCPGCPQTTAQVVYQQNPSPSLEDCLTCPHA